MKLKYNTLKEESFMSLLYKLFTKLNNFSSGSFPKNLQKFK